MNTKHNLFVCDSTNTSNYIKDNSVALVITSPPYPMIEMWDECFSSQSLEVKEALASHNHEAAFENMHLILDRVWEDVDRLMIDGGIVCINIGDATKNCDGQFKLFSNHSRIIQKFLQMGYDVLPDIHWHKPTNAPNKFMGSGMYPPCAYITYEHEYILVFRKGANRKFNNSDKEARHHSAYFWEERNIWFSDLWELKGTGQKLNLKSTRERSAAFPFELAYRIINMFSIENDIVYDPFAGTGTVAKAAMASSRNSIGVDLDEVLVKEALKDLLVSQKPLNKYIDNRINNHIAFIDGLSEEKKANLYQNNNHNFKVKTRQETDIRLNEILDIQQCCESIECTYNKADA